MNEKQGPLNPIVHPPPQLSDIKKIFLKRSLIGSCIPKQKMIFGENRNPFGISGYEDVYKIAFHNGQYLSFLAYWNQNSLLQNGDKYRGNYGRLYLYEDPFDIVLLGDQGIRKELSKYLAQGPDANLANFNIEPIMIIDVVYQTFVGDPILFEPFADVVEEIFKRTIQIHPVPFGSESIQMQFMIQNGKVVLFQNALIEHAPMTTTTTTTTTNPRFVPLEENPEFTFENFVFAEFHVPNPYRRVLCNNEKAFYYVIKQLGSGAYGSAYSIEFNEKMQGLDHRYYAIKTVDPPPEKKQHLLTQKNCFLSKKYTGWNGQVVRFNHAFVCEVYSEYIFGSLLSHQNCINFIETIGYSPCPTDIYRNPRSQIYILMEKADGDARHIFEDRSLTSNELNNICLQVFIGIAFMEQNHVNHNDVHLGNIFQIKVDGHTMYQGQRIKDYDYVSYEFPSLGIDPIYIPVSKLKYIMKIADFGISQKYSSPSILNLYVSKSKSIPNYYNTVYDLFVFLNHVTTAIYFTNLNLPLFMSNCVSWILGIPFFKNMDELNIWWNANQQSYAYLHLPPLSQFRNVPGFIIKLLKIAKESKRIFKYQREYVNLDLSQLSSEKYKHVSAHDLLRNLGILGYNFERPLQHSKILNIGRL